MVKPKKSMKPLSMTAPGEHVKLIDVHGGRGIRQRLSAMGLLPGVPLTVIANSASGPVTIAIKGTRLMLGRGMVHRIMVA